MEKRLTAKHKIICENNDSLFNYFAWPSVAKLQDGKLAMVASGFRLRHVCPFGKGIICYSFDEGETWTKPAAIIDTPLDVRDCSIVPFDKSRVMVTTFTNTVAFQRYRNDLYEDKKYYNLVEEYLKIIEGTDAEEKYLGSLYTISNDCGITFGELKKVPVTAPHGPCVLNDGSLLYVGRLFDHEHKDEIQCYKFTAEGEFEYLSSIENVSDEIGPLLSCEPHAIQLPSGKILVLIRVQRNDPKVRTIYQCESYDNGKSWTKPVAVLEPNGGMPPHLLLHSTGVLICSYSYRKPPFGQKIMFSLDEGKTWEKDYILRDDGPLWDLGYPATIELSDSSLLTVYYQYPQGKSHPVIMQSNWKLPDLK